MRSSIPLWLLLAADICLAQTVVYTTGPNGSISAYLIASNGTSTTSASPTSSSTSVSSITITSTHTSITPSTTIMLPTAPYTGQALLVGSCSVPAYTALRYADGHFIEVPLIGCSDDRPECCPSLNIPAAASTSTSQSLSGNTTAAAAPTPSGVISMLSRAPLTVCPSDMVDIDPVCCPSGFTKWGQAILGNTPCASLLSTSYPLPSTVLNSLTSSVAASASSASGTAAAAEATQSITVIVNTVFALGLPCADNEEGGGDSETEHGGLSTGAKAGIGVGVGVGVILAIVLGAWVCVKRRRRRDDQPELPQVVQTGPVGQTTECPAKMQSGPQGWNPTSPQSPQDAGFTGYGQGFVDGVKAALSSPTPAPQSPPPPFYRSSFSSAPVEAPSEITRHSRPPLQDEAAELSGSNTNTRSSVV